MKTILYLSVGLVALSLNVLTAAESKDIDLRTKDGITLKATYTSPGLPGPGMFLIHQCNMDRASWIGITEELVSAGIHVLTLDLRGFGDSGGEGISGGFPSFLEKSAFDADLAFEFLVAQPGVDPLRIGVGGASCGGMILADLVSRRTDVKALMLLSSPPSEKAVKGMVANPGLAIFAAATEEDPVTVGVADTLQGVVNDSKHPDSTVKIFSGTEHGLPMFEKNPSLKPALLIWLKARLTD